MDRAEPLIAVVDDESPMRTMLGRVLRLADYRVCAFASGEEFLASLDGQRPDCAVLDIHMPGLSGFEVQVGMRTANFVIPVVFITASDDVALDHLASDLHAVALLRKPFSSSEILGAVGLALGGKDGLNQRPVPGTGA